MINATKTLVATMAISMCLLNGCDQQGSTTADEHYNQAVQNIENNDHGSGIIELKNALQKKPEYGEARWLLAIIYSKMGDGNSSISEFKQAISLGYKPSTMIPYFEALLRTSDYKKVIEETEQLAIENPSAELLSIRAHAYMGMGEIDKATLLFNEAMAINQESVITLLGLVRLSISFNDLAEAEMHLDKALGISPENHEAYILKAAIEISRRNYSAAIDAYQKGLKTAEFNPNLLFGLIRVQIAEGLYDEASALVEKTERLFPDNLKSTYYRGYIDYLKNNYAAAKESLRTVLKSNRSHPRTLLLLGNINYKEGQIEQAEEYISEYNKHVPDDIGASKLLAAIQIRLQQYDKAKSNLKHVLLKEPTDSKALALLGNANMHSGNIEEGMKLLNQAARISPDSSEIKVQIALSQLVQGNLEEAIDIFKSDADVSTNNLGHQMFKVMSSLRDDNLDNSMAATKTLIKQFPNEPSPLNLAGVISMRLLDHELARLYFAKAIQKNSEFIPAILNLAKIEETSGNHDESLRLYQEISALNNTNLEAQLGMARLYIQMDKPESAIKKLKAAWENNPESVEPAILLSNYYIALNNPRAAIKFAEQGIERNPDNGDIQLTYAKALAAGGKKDDAQILINKLFKKHHNSIPNLLELARLQMLLNNTDDARDILNRAMQLNKQNVDVLSSLALLEMETGNLPVSRKHIDQMIEVTPDSARPYILKGKLLRAMKKDKDALKAFRQAEQLSPEDHLTLIDIYQTLIALKQKDKAINELLLWLEKHPDHIVIKTLLASQYEYFGDINSALKHYEEVLKLNDTNVLALNNLAWIYFKQGNDKASKLAKQAFNLASNNPQVIDTYAWLLVNEGKVEEGLNLLEEASVIEPDAAGIQFHLASALEKVSKKERAIEILSKLLANNKKFEERADAQALFDKLK